MAEDGKGGHQDRSGTDTDQHPASHGGCQRTGLGKQQPTQGGEKAATGDHQPGANPVDQWSQRELGHGIDIKQDTCQTAQLFRCQGQITADIGRDHGQ